MNFSLTDNQIMIRDSVRAFAEKELLPHYKHWDRSGEWLTQDYMKKIVDMGLLRLRLPEKFGGQGYSFVDCGIVCEEIGRADHQIRYINSNAIHLGEMAHAMHPDLQDEWIPRISNGEMMSLAFTEPRGGADAGNIVTKAVRDGDHWVLNGEKTWISNGGIADFYVVFAKTDPQAGARGITAFIVDADNPGLDSTAHLQVMSPHPLATLTFHQCALPAQAQLGDTHGGFKLAMRTLDIFRASVAAAALGMARRALHEATQFAQNRRMFGQTLADFQLTQARLGEMAALVDAAALLTYRAAWMRDTQGSSGEQAAAYTQAAAMAKYTATENAQKVIDMALQMHGGRGVEVGVKVEALYRDIRALRIYEGASEVQLLIMGKSVLKGVST